MARIWSEERSSSAGSTSSWRRSRLGPRSAGSGGRRPRDPRPRAHPDDGTRRRDRSANAPRHRRVRRRRRGAARRGRTLGPLRAHVVRRRRHGARPPDPGRRRLILEARARPAAVVRRADEHRQTLMIGRTHGVHAEPTTFGLKLAGWAFELDRDRVRLERALEGLRVGKLSGAVGTYAATEPEVERVACERLGLEPAPSRRRSSSATGTRRCLRRSRSPRPRSRTSRSRSAIWPARRSARSRSRSAAARRARPRCRTSATRSSPNGSAGSPGSFARPRRRPRERCALARARHLALVGRARRRCQTRSSRSTTCSTASPGSSRASSSSRSACGATSRRATASSSATAAARPRRGGLARDDAYRLVQRNAMRAWEEEQNFRELVRSDSELAGRARPRRAVRARAVPPRRRDLRAAARLERQGGAVHA